MEEKEEGLKILKGWKEDGVYLSERNIKIEKESFGKHLGEKATIEEEIKREKKLEEENKNLRTILKRLEEEKELWQQALLDAKNITKEDLDEAYQQVILKILREK